MIKGTITTAIAAGPPPLGPLLSSYKTRKSLNILHILGIFKQREIQRVANVCGNRFRPETIGASRVFSTKARADRKGLFKSRYSTTFQPNTVSKVKWMGKNHIS